MVYALVSEASGATHTSSSLVQRTTKTKLTFFARKVSFFCQKGRNSIVEIKELIDKTKIKIVKDINFEMVLAYWNIRKKIVNEENKYDKDSSYGDFIADDLSKKLRKTYGKGFFRSNLFFMRKLFLTYKKVQTPSGHWAGPIIRSYFLIR